MIKLGKKNKGVQFLLREKNVCYNNKKDILAKCSPVILRQKLPRLSKTTTITKLCSSLPELNEIQKLAPSKECIGVPVAISTSFIPNTGLDFFLLLGPAENSPAPKRTRNATYEAIFFRTKKNKIMSDRTTIIHIKSGKKLTKSQGNLLWWMSLIASAMAPISTTTMFSGSQYRDTCWLDGKQNLEILTFVSSKEESLCRIKALSGFTQENGNLLV